MLPLAPGACYEWIPQTSRAARGGDTLYKLRFGRVRQKRRRYGCPNREDPMG